MKTVLLSDVHGNALALQRVLSTLETEVVDQYVFLGDAILFGPQPHETVAILQALPNLTCILGNTDVWFYDPPPENEIKTAEDRRRLGLIEWGTAQLTPQQVAFVKSFQPWAKIDLGSGLTLLAYHGTPASASERLVATTPDEAVEQFLAGWKAEVYAGGHTHFAMLRRWNDRWLVNPGSLGLSWKQTSNGLRPRRAEFMVITVENGILEISMRAVPIDRQALESAARESNLPGRESYLSEWE